MTKPIMFKIGHVLIKVTDLQQAVLDYQKLGFNVVMGGLPGKATNAMIYFLDGSFIELYSTPMGRISGNLIPKILRIIRTFNRGKADRYINYTSSPEGMNDYALDSVPSDAFLENLKQLNVEGFTVSKPTHMKRIDAKNQKKEWNLSFPEDYRFPFFMDAYVPKLEPTKAEMMHQNGVSGIKELVIQVPDYKYFINHYKKLTSNYREEDQQSLFYFDDSCVIIRRNPLFKMVSITLVSDTELNLPVELTHGVDIKG